MKLPSVFKWWRGNDDDLTVRRAESDVLMRQIIGDIRNQAQVMQSGSRKLHTMARTMELIREGRND